VASVDVRMRDEHTTQTHTHPEGTILVQYLICPVGIIIDCIGNIN
jgi:hypothetical protein